jgi:hypothetical protein
MFLGVKDPDPSVTKQEMLEKIDFDLFLVDILKATDEKSRIRIRIRNCVVRIRGSGSYQNVTYPQHW